MENLEKLRYLLRDDMSITDVINTLEHTMSLTGNSGYSDACANEYLAAETVPGYQVSEQAKLWDKNMKNRGIINQLYNECINGSFTEDDLRRYFEETPEEPEVDELYGYGVKTYDNGETLEGKFSMGEPVGLHRHTYPDGRAYWMEYDWRNQVTYDEEKDKVIDGFGKAIYSSTSFYEGDFMGGLPHGYGKMYYDTNGLVYKGEWKNGKRNGQGELYQVLPELHTIYEGLWEDDHQAGQ